MKKILLFTLTLFALAAAIAWSIKPAIILLAKNQFQNIFSGSTVSIKTCDLKVFSRISLSGIEIQKPGAYDLKLGELSAEYSVWSIFQKKILRIHLKNSVADISLTQQNTLPFTSASARPSAALVSVNTLEISDLACHVKSRDMNLESRVSAKLDLTQSSLDSLDLKISSFVWRDFTLEEGTIKISTPQAGELFIQKLQYGKFKVTDMTARVKTAPKSFQIDSISGRTLRGTIAGDLSLKMDPSFKYLAAIIFTNLDLAGVVQDFDLKDEVQMSGMISGNVTLTGKGSDIRILDGNFSAADAGGLLVIKNAEFLKHIARNSKQPLDIVVASFKDYRYNVGSMQFSLEKGDLVFSASLDGETGKRDLNITLHNFNLGKEGL